MHSSQVSDETSNFMSFFNQASYTNLYKKKDFAIF